MNNETRKTFAEWVRETDLDPYMPFDMYMACLTDVNAEFPDYICGVSMDESTFKMIVHALQAAFQHGRISQKLSSK